MAKRSKRKAIGSTKTLRLRVIRPFFSEEIEQLLTEEKEKRYNAVLKETGDKKAARAARHIKSNDKFWRDLKDKTPGLVLWPELGAFLREYQKLVAETYNECMARLYVEKILPANKKSKSMTSLLGECTNLATEKLGSSYVGLGLTRKLQSNFRENELKYHKVSLPTMKFDSVPIPINMGSGNFKLNLQNSRNDFVITLPFPNHEIIDEQKETGKKEKRTFPKLVLTKKKNDLKHISLILGVQGRKRNKSWNLDKGTDAEIRRLITIGPDEKTEHERKWMNYFESLPAKEKQEFFQGFERGKVKWKTVKKAYSISEKMEKDKNKNKEEYADWKNMHVEKYLKEHPYSKETFQEDFLKKAKITHLEIIRGKKRLHQGTDWFVNFVINLPPKTQQEIDALDPSVSGGIDIGVSSPIVCAINNSLDRLAVKRNDVAEHNRKMKARTRLLLKKNSLQRKGHGAKNKLRPITELNERSELFKKKIIERWASEVVNFFKKQKANTVQMEDLSSMKERDDNYFNQVLRISWPYAQMQDQIKRKLEEEGITVKFVNPYKTSQICSSDGKNNCGHKRNDYFTFKYRQSKKFPEFKCQFCGYKENADYNAARNIANPNIETLAKPANNV